MLQATALEVGSPAPPTVYHLECSQCRASFADDGLVLRCPHCDSTGLLRAVYPEAGLRLDEHQSGLFRYRRYLPIARAFAATGETVVFRSPDLCRFTGLDNLWIAFNGYWPERNASLRSCSFKELEAMCVLARHPEDSGDTLVVASAGNTANAFALASSALQQRCLIVVPESALAYLQFEVEITPCVRIVVLERGDYSDAIALAERVGRQPGFVLEGGVRNVARRAGLGTVLYKAYEAIGMLPDIYFQAIGSGAGAIGVAESARQLAGREDAAPRMWLSQNLPFTPVADAWSSGQSSWPATSAAHASEQRSAIHGMSAPVLANRNPPYAVRGGLFDLLSATGGNVAAISNREAAEAAALFEQYHGIDIDSAAAVALAHLLQCAKATLLPRHATVLLNITGGGRKRLARQTHLRPHTGDLRVCLEDAQHPSVLDRVRSQFL